MISLGLLTAAAATVVPPNFCAPGLSLVPPIPPAERSIEDQQEVPHGDKLGDSWEMEEVACWRGIWLRRGSSSIWDGYWIHPRGERARATLEISAKGRPVLAIRRHDDGKSCRYEGTMTSDWWEVRGTYRCSWDTSVLMPWRAQIIRLERSEPALLRDEESVTVSEPGEIVVH